MPAKRAQTAHAGRPRAKGGLGSARSPQKGRKGVRTAKPARAASTSNSPFRPLEASPGSPSPHKRAFEEDPNSYNGFNAGGISGGDVLQNLSKEDRDICLLMVDMLSRQNYVTSSRIVASLSQRLDLERYMYQYGGTIKQSDIDRRVQDIDGRRELIEQLSTQRQQYAEEGKDGQRSQYEEQESRRSEWVSANGKKFSNSSKVPRPPAKKSRAGLPPKSAPQGQTSHNASYLNDISGDYSDSIPSTTEVSPYKKAASSGRPSLSISSPIAAKAAPQGGAANVSTGSTHSMEDSLKKPEPVAPAPPAAPVVAPPPAEEAAPGGLDWLTGSNFGNTSATPAAKPPSIDKEEVSAVEETEESGIMDEVEDEIEDEIEEEDTNPAAPSTNTGGGFGLFDDQSGKLPWDDI
ncbi:hypothetical protein, conserved [Angomonas deanei]|uniref:Uncharacterized protein n=1 Tax=Angomonas deanei TaxID=59799 RepID=A0A7G2C0V0_9TRYP|nr:hypothetical protein, conserved [Angomonas deanei]